VAGLLILLQNREEAIRIGEMTGKAEGMIDFVFDLGYSNEKIIFILQEKLRSQLFLAVPRT